MKKKLARIDTGIPHHIDTMLEINKNFLDLPKLIRSIQRAEGNHDCFQKAEGYCNRIDCAWRQYCLEGHEDRLSDREVLGV